MPTRKTPAPAPAPARVAADRRRLSSIASKPAPKAPAKKGKP